MPRSHLSVVSVERLKAPKGKQIDHFDISYPGLALRVSYGGRRVWVYHCRWGGKLRRVRLGAFPAMGLAEARQEWRKASERLRAGLEPKPPAEASAPTTQTADIFRMVAAEWLKRDQSENRSHDEVKRILDKEVLRTLGDVHIAAITRRQLAKLIDDIADRGAPTLARRCHAHLHRMLRWSVGRGIIETSPMVYLPKPGSEVKRKRVLSDVEIKLVWHAAREIGWPFGYAVKLLLLTCARRDEIGRLQWHEIEQLAAVPVGLTHRAAQ